MIRANLSEMRMEMLRPKEEKQWAKVTSVAVAEPKSSSAQGRPSSTVPLPPILHVAMGTELAGQQLLPHRPWCPCLQDGSEEEIQDRPTEAPHLNVPSFKEPLKLDTLGQSPTWKFSKPGHHPGINRSSGRTRKTGGACSQDTKGRCATVTGKRAGGGDG